MNLEKILPATILLIAAPFIATAASYDIYVDQSNTGTEDGSKANPYNTIGEAITAAQSNDADHRRIHVKKGEYREQITLTAGVKLYGKDKNDVKIIGRDASKDDFKYAVKMKDGTRLEDITVKYGKYGVLVDKDSKAKIKDCKIKKADKVGIKVLDAERKNSKKFTLKNSKIYDSDKKGLEIEKRKVNIEDNKIYDNDEEGLDFRSSVKGDVKNNEIYGNGEVGIELEMKKVKLDIDDNEIKSNKTSGIAVQYRPKYEWYRKKNDIEIASNSVKRNNDWGLRCNNPIGGKPPVHFFSKSIDLLKNSFISNGKGKYSSLCNF